MDVIHLAARRIVGFALCSATLTLLSSGCGMEQSEVAPPPPPEVTVAKPLARAVTSWLEFTGTTDAILNVDIRPRVSGHLLNVAFQEGVVVNEGDLLYEIDPRPYQAAVDSEAAILESRKAERQLAIVKLTRVKTAFEKGGTTELEVIEHQALRDQAAAAVALAEASLQAAQLNLDFTKIHAPFRGRIDKTNYDEGDLVGPGNANPLTDLVQMRPIYAYFNLSEQELITLMTDARAAGRTIGDRPTPRPVYLAIGDSLDYDIEGTFDFASNTVDPGTGTILLRAIFENDDQALMPGLFVRLRSPIGDPGEALLVPDLALSADQRGRFLYVVNEQNVVEDRPVQIGQLIDSMRVITGGITQNDRVVINGLMRCRPGLVVSPTEETLESSLQVTPTDSDPVADDADQ